MYVPCLHTTKFETHVNSKGQVELTIRRPFGFTVVLVLMDSPLMFRNLYLALEAAERQTGTRKRMAKAARRRMTQVVVLPKGRKAHKKRTGPVQIAGGLNTKKEKPSASSKKR